MGQKKENSKKESSNFHFNKNVQEAQQEYMDALRAQNRKSNTPDDPLINMEATKDRTGTSQTKNPSNKWRKEEPPKSSGRNERRGSSNFHFNKNVQDAHQEYINAFRTQGYQMNTLDLKINSANDTSKEKLDTSQIMNPSNKWRRVGNLGSLATQVAGRYTYASSAEGSDFAQGVRISSEMYGTAALLALDSVRHTLSNRMATEMNYHIEDYNQALAKHGDDFVKKYSMGGKVKNRDNISTMYEGYRAMVNHSLLHKGKRTMNLKFDSVPSKNMVVQLSSFLMKNKDILSQEDIVHIKRMMQLCRIDNVRPVHGRLHAVRRQGMLKIMRYGSQTDAGHALFTSFNFAQRAIRTFRIGVRAARVSAHAAHMGALLSMKAAAWAAAKISSKIPESIKNTQVIKQVQKGKEVIDSVAGKGRKVTRKARNTTRNVRNVYEKVRNFGKDPFHLKRNARRAGDRAKKGIINRLNKTFLRKPIKYVGKGFRAVNFIGSAIGRLVSVAMSLVSTLFSILMFALVLMILLALVISVITAIISTVASLFDFTSTEEEIRDAALDQIETCYDLQNTSISNILSDSRYRNVSLNYVDVRDDAAYEKKENQPVYPFTETTNSAEILSMATVYFDFDLEEAGVSKVKNYVRNLYNGSHITTVVEKEYKEIETYIDDKGKEQQREITYIDADVTLTSYYFNALFECSLQSGTTGVLAGTEVSEQVWNYFRSIGFSEQATAGIMGNMYQESRMNPAALQNGVGPAAGICQWEKYGAAGTRWGNLQAFAQSRGKNWTDLQCQLDFLVMELNGGDPTTKYIMDRDYGGLANFKRATDINWAVEAFERSFERAGIPNMQVRYTQANAYYAMYHGREVVNEEK